MENFRKNLFYRLSLCSLLLASVFWGLVVLFVMLKFKLNISEGVFIVVVPILLLMSLLFRIISTDPLKKWWDIIFVILVIILALFGIDASIKCYYFKLCSLSRVISWIGLLFLIISIITTIKYLISDIKRKRTISNIV